MQPKIEHYHRREHSYIKHLFLQHYLASAAYKLLIGRAPVLNFVDAFAGPWRSTDAEGLSDTSFDLALNTLERVRSSLSAAGWSGLAVRFRLCERNPDAAARLQAYAARKPEFDIRVFPGSFEDNLNPIKEACLDTPRSFTFTFIDPTGWNVDSGPIFQFLRELRGEVLFNYMAEHINRHGGWEGVTASVGRFLADPGWRPAFEAMQTGSTEEKVLKLFKENLKAAGGATYLPDLAIYKPREERIKMRLVLGTRSASGVEVFRRAQLKVEELARLTRHRIRSAETNQTSLFSDEQLVHLDLERDGVGCPANIAKAQAEFLAAVVSRPGSPFGKLAAEVMERVPVLPKHLNRIALDQRRAGVLRFQLPAGKRTPSEDERIYRSEA